LQTYAEIGRILPDNETYHLVKDTMGDVEEMRIPLKGFAEPIRAHAVRSIENADAATLERTGVHSKIRKSHMPDDHR
jgi:class 3 adenylate cyclase